jgi:hypothetical protein
LQARSYSLPRGKIWEKGPAVCRLRLLCVTYARLPVTVFAFAVVFSAVPKESLMASRRNDEPCRIKPFLTLAALG